MKKRFDNKQMQYITLGLTFIKVLATFGCFFYNRLLPVAFPAVIYVYIFIFSLFSTNFDLALSWLPYLFVGSVLPAGLSVLFIRYNQRGAGFAAFVLALLCTADILFVLAYPLTSDLLFAISGILLNLMIIASSALMHVPALKKTEG